MTDTPLSVEGDLKDLKGPKDRRRMGSFLLGLFLLCASTLMYEIVLTRLLSVTCWYYLAFVSVSMAMFGMWTRWRVRTTASRPRHRASDGESRRPRHRLQRLRH
jgi:hypothetical protein